ncbi:MAG: small ribosomal subunit Rsm22 family protein [Christensenellales bacterium]
MELPAQLKAGVEAQAAGADRRAMAAISETLTLRYRGARSGARLLTTADEASVYSVVRMPATYGAVRAALQSALDVCDFRPRSLIDIGAGTGAATWAAESLLFLERVMLIEREDAMRALGRAYMQNGSDALRDAAWIDADIARDEIGATADVVVASYALNELSEDARMDALDKLWRAAEGMLLIVEPGTPEGYRQLIAARAHLLKNGAHIVAPCPHARECPMEGSDWCHFSVRIARGKLHKQLKGGDAPYEDEKFAYMAFSRAEGAPAPARVLRHPRIEKGKVTLTLCGDGGIAERAYRKRDGEAYKRARKADWGDAFE